MPAKVPDVTTPSFLHFPRSAFHVLSFFHAQLSVNAWVTFQAAIFPVHTRGNIQDIKYGKRRSVPTLEEANIVFGDYILSWNYQQCHFRVCAALYLQLELYLLRQETKVLFLHLSPKISYNDTNLCCVWVHMLPPNLKH